MKHFLLWIFAICLARANMVQGQTWTSLNGLQVASNIKDISITAAGSELYVAEQSYVMKSTNSGTAWKPSKVTYSSPSLILVKPDDATKVLAAISGSLVYNDQAGDASTWDAKISDSYLTPLRLMATVNDATQMLLGKTYNTNSVYPIYRSGDGGATWAAVTGFTSHTHISDFASYPNDDDGWAAGIVWAGGVDPDGTPDGANNSSTADNSGLWFSTNYGATWNADRLGNCNVRSVELVPRTYSTDYVRLISHAVSNGNDVLKRNTSLSNHTLWTNIALNPAPADIYLIRRKNSNGYIFLATSNGVWVSTSDDGESFTRIGLSGIDVKTIAVSSPGNNVFAGTSTTLYKSTDNGSTWKDVGIMNVSSVAGEGATAWAVTRDNSFVGIFSGSWSNSSISTAGASFSAEHVYADANSEDIFVVGSLGGFPEIQKSEDDGGPFSTVPLAEGWTAGAGSVYRASVDLVADDDFIYYGGGANMDDGNTVEWRNIFFSENEGETWQPYLYSLGDGLPSPDKVYDYLVNDDDLRFVALSKGMVRRSSNGGGGWSTVLSASGVAYSVTLNPNAVSRVYVGRSNGLFRSTDGGASFPSAIHNSDVRRVLMNPTYPTSGDHIYALVNTGSASDIKTSTNGGTDWSSMNTGIPTTSVVNDIQTSPYTGYLYAGTSTGVYAIDLVPAAPQGLAGSWSSTHPKLDWTANTEADLQAYDIYKYYRNCDYYNPPTHCGSPYSEDYLTTVTGTTYTDATESSAGGEQRVVGYKVIAVDEYDHESIASAIEFQVALGEESRANISPRAEEELPKVFSLSQNYPNPFNPVTTFNYTLPVDVHVILKMYDVMGREVVTLVDEVQRAGYKSITFDAGKLASGVYIYKIIAGSFVNVKKMIVTK